MTLQCSCLDDIEGLIGGGVCDYPCTDYPSLLCGGYGTISMYEHDVDTDPEDVDTEPEDPSCRGCYSDSAENRIFVPVGSSDDMAAEYSTEVAARC
ncbi:hypothetical protein Esi_0039_0157 [Ectocarpus siliculosus]|uniref:Uncharacterized protein n=1 Tax=Ectocarpus siliculosus TaxID=2880 RepID=D7G024_ECTSI|nr:hypothetical protein Esi_0039_0157 [Ectocarpus siliculosus]|eukprot:CBJ48649.1 hypothetical protein Esi_0039_0157 [Ectocarpus siliculosus]